MASSLIGGRTKDRVTDKGHGTDALGPSDSSDSASDIVGGPGIAEVELDSDTDSAGTGERATAGRDPLTRVNDDVLPDHIEQVLEVDGDEEDSGGKRG